MMSNDGLLLVAPKIVPVLDPNFRPASLANRAFRVAVAASGNAQPVRIAIEQADGSVFRFDTQIFAEGHASAAGTR